MFCFTYLCFLCEKGRITILDKPAICFLCEKGHITILDKPATSFIPFFSLFF